MTKRIGDTVYSYQELSQQCDFCGKIEELRPYGPNEECLCFECAMEDPEAARARFKCLLAEGER